MRSLTSATAHSDSTQPWALSRMAVISSSDMMRLRVVEVDCLDRYCVCSYVWNACQMSDLVWIYR